MIVVTCDVSAKCFLKSCLCFLRVVAEIRDVTHKEQPQLVSPIVEARLIYLDVKSEEIESEFFRAFDVPANGFICQERIHTFRVKRLIERAEQVDGTVVEIDILIISTRCLRDGNLPHSEVGVNPIADGVFHQQFKRHVVKVWRIYVPQAEVFGRDRKGPVCLATRNFNCPFQSIAIPTQRESCIFFVSVYFNRKRGGGVVNVGCYVALCDVCFVSGF